MKLIKIQSDALPKTQSFSFVSIHPLDQVALPLFGPWGTATPVVSDGDAVHRGQVIARYDDPRLPPIRASLAGLVQLVAQMVDFRGVKGQGIRIQSAEGVNRDEEPVEGNEQDVASWAKTVARLGIVESDQHCWPFPARLLDPQTAKEAFGLEEPPFDRSVDTLIIHGLDRQPGEFVRRAVMEAFPADVGRPLPLLARASRAKKIYFLCEKDAQIPTELEEALRGVSAEVRRMNRDYPAALLPMAIQILTGREVPQPAGDPRLVGAAVVDVLTCAHVGEWMVSAKVPLEALVQVSVPSRGETRFFKVPIGTPLGRLLQEVGGEGSGKDKVILGGLMLGHAQFDLDVPLGFGVSSVTVQTEPEVHRYRYRACVGCGHCVAVCPMKLMPNELSKLVEYGRYDDAEKAALFHCIECGLCAYVCPSHRPMVQFFRQGKNEVKAMREVS